MANIVVHGFDLVKNTLYVLSISFLKLIHESTPLGKHDPDEFCPICILFTMDDGWHLVTHRKKKCCHKGKATERVNTSDRGFNQNDRQVTNHRVYHDQIYSFPRGMVKAFRTRQPKDDTYHHGVYFRDRSRRKCFKSCQKANIKIRDKYVSGGDAEEVVLIQDFRAGSEF